MFRPIFRQTSFPLPTDRFYLEPNVQMPVCVRQSMLVFPYPALAAPRANQGHEAGCGHNAPGSCPVSRTFAALAQFGSGSRPRHQAPKLDRGARLCRAAEAAPIPAHASPGTGCLNHWQPPMATWMTCRSRISAVSESDMLTFIRDTHKGSSGRNRGKRKSSTRKWKKGLEDAVKPSKQSRQA